MCTNSAAIKSRRDPPNPLVFPHTIQNAQQLWLHWYEWWPRTCAAKDVKGVLFVVSGLGEHGQRYDGFAEEVAEELQFAVFCLDHQGHGLSEGERKFVEKFTHYVDDYLLFLMTVFAKYGHTNKHNIDITQLPRFLLGHSMGGLIALHTARACASMGIPEVARAVYDGNKDNNNITASSLLTADKHQLFFNSVILSGPAIKPDPSVATPTKVKLARMLSNMAPKMGLGNLEIPQICSNPQVVENAQNDVLFAKEPLRARWGYEMLVAMGEVQEKPEQFVNFPLLIVHGELDTLALSAGSEDFFQHKALEKHTDKKYVLYKGKKHEILNEIGCEEVRADVKEFIRSHMGHHPRETIVVAWQPTTNAGTTQPSN